VELNPLPGLLLVLQSCHDVHLLLAFVPDFAFGLGHNVEILAYLLLIFGRLLAHGVSMLMLENPVVLDFVEFWSGQISKHSHFVLGIGERCGLEW